MTRNFNRFPFLRLVCGCGCACAAVASSCVDDKCDIEDDVSLMQVSLMQVQSIVTHGNKGTSAMSRSTDLDAIQKERKPLKLQEVFQTIASAARSKLVAGTLPGAQPADPSSAGAIFSAVDISLPLAPPVIQYIPTYDEPVGQSEMEAKNIIDLSLKAPCIVYGIGIASAQTYERPTFERDMAAHGCETHGFDCTVDVTDPNVAKAPFHFHPWCIGSNSVAKTSLKHTIYVEDDTKELQFHTLADTMKKLGHTSIDLLKFDIEGFEWELFKNELIPSPTLPAQMSFELHTSGADPHYVPEENVAGKSFIEVNKLFLDLFDKGYRVVSKLLNAKNTTSGLSYCAEFVVVNATWSQN